MQNGKIESKWNFTDLDFYGSKSLNEAAKHAAANPQLLLFNNFALAALGLFAALIITLGVTG